MAGAPAVKPGEAVSRRGLNQSQGGIYIDTGLASTSNTVIPANAGVTKDLLLQVAKTNPLPIAAADSRV